MYHNHQQQRRANSNSLAIVSSVLFPHHTEGSLVKRRRVNLQSLPGAWIEDKEEDEEEEESDQLDTGEEEGEEKDKDDNKENNQIFVKTVSSTPPKLLLNTTITIQTSSSGNVKEQDIEKLKQTIENLRKEKQKLEETNDIVKKSIQIVARKRLIAQKENSSKKKKDISNSSDYDTAGEDDEEDIYIVVPSDFIPPTQDEMKAAGLDGWEWISAY